jgi:LPXTG-motif cell wall-anchored protein
MIDQYGIIQSVLCNSPIKPPAPGCVYGLPEEYGQELMPVKGIVRQNIDLIAEKQAATMKPSLLTPEEFQAKKAMLAEKEAKKKQQQLILAVGGGTAVVLLGLGAFFLIRKRKGGKK